MKLSLPTFKDPLATLTRWASEIRKVNFLTDRDLVWQSWQPVWTGSGSMTYTVTSQRAEYINLFDKIVFIDVAANGTTGGVASSGITFTLPISPDTSLGADNILYSGHFSAVTVPASGYHAAATLIFGDGTVIVRRYDSANWPLGVARVFVQGWYRALP